MERTIERDREQQHVRVPLQTGGGWRGGGWRLLLSLEARECVVVLSRVVDAMRTLFEELDLEDVRKAPWI